MKTELKMLDKNEIKLQFETYYLHKLNSKYNTIEDCISNIKDEELELFCNEMIKVFKEVNGFVPNRTLDKLTNKIKLTVKYYKRDKTDKWWKSARRY